MENIRLLFITKDSRGGMETFINQLRSIDCNRYEKSFLFLKKEDFVKYKQSDIFISNSYPKELNFTVNKLFLFINNLHKTKNIVKKTKPHIIIAFDIYSFILSSLIKYSTRNIKLVQIINNNLYKILSMRKQKVYILLIKKTFQILSRLCDIQIYTSKKLAEFTNSHFNILNSKHLVIPNSVDVENVIRLGKVKLAEKEKKLFNKNKKTANLIYVGRIDKQKDVVTILKAFLIIHKKIDSKLFIIGDGDEMVKLKQMIMDLELNRDVLLLGWKNNPFKYIKACDLFLFSSYFEGFAQVIIEALLLGIPVLSTDSPYGPSEILDNGKYGLLVNIGDYCDMASKTINLLRNRNKMNYFSKLGVERAKHYSTNTMLESYDRVFTSLVN